MAKEIRFPRTLYKKGGDIRWGKDIMYSTELVKDEKEFNAAIKAGYIDDFSKALSGKEEVSVDVDIDEDF